MRLPRCGSSSGAISEEATLGWRHFVFLTNRTEPRGSWRPSIAQHAVVAALDRRPPTNKACWGGAADAVDDPAGAGCRAGVNLCGGGVDRVRELPERRAQLFGLVLVETDCAADLGGDAFGVGVHRIAGVSEGDLDRAFVV
jgi:hypothetical protein